MNGMITFLNTAGKSFIDFSASMLIQSSVIIILLLLLNVLLRKKVRAVFLYWIWMLILVKLVLPTTLSSPTGLGYWFGDKVSGIINQKTSISEQTVPIPRREERVNNTIPSGTEIATLPSNSASTELVPDNTSVIFSDAATPIKIPLSWKGFAFLGWLCIVNAMVLLLMKRMFFVRNLLAQSKKPNDSMLDIFKRCSKQMEVHRSTCLKISPDVASPSVCGLLQPTILIPYELQRILKTEDLKPILLHELAHIKRGDLWISLIQTILQIAYFYNPLLWVANSVIRRIREQAVDEMVLVAMGEQAGEYPETLLNISRLTFSQPVVSLRLIGVVESKKALSQRIKRILHRPFPKSGKLGFFGLLVIIVTGTILLPMAKSNVIRESRKVKALVKTLQDDSSQKRGKAAEDLMEEISRGRIINASASQALRAITQRIKKLPKKMNRKRGFDSYPNIYLEEVGLAFELILNNKVKQNEAVDFLQALELVGCTYGEEGENVFRLFGQLTNPRKDIVVNCNLSVVSIDGKKSVSDLFNVFPIWGGGNYRWGREIKKELEPQQSIEMKLFVAWYQVPEIALKSLPESLRDRDIAIKEIAQNTTAKKFCEYTQTLTLSQDSDWKGIFGKDSLINFEETNIEPKPFKVTLSNGLTVELLGLKDARNGEENLWWSPNGKILEEPIHQTNLDPYGPDGNTFDVNNTFEREIAFRFPKQPKAINIMFKPSNRKHDHIVNYRHSLIDRDDKTEIRSENAIFPTESKYTNVRVGVSFKENPPYTDQDYKWVEFKNIVLHPDMRTYVQVKSQKSAAIESPEKSQVIEDENNDLNDSFSAVLPDGVKVELLGVCDHPSAGKQWWRPDGTPLDTHEFRDYDYDDAVTVKEDQYAKLLALKFDDTVVQDAGITWSLEDSRESRFAPDYVDRTRTKRRSVQVILAAFPNTIESTNLRLGIAAGPWKTVASGTPGRGAHTNDNITQSDVIYHEAREKNGYVRISATHLLGRNYDCRIYARGQNDEVYEPRSYINPGADMRHCKSEFDIPLEKVKMFHLQARPYQWVTFKNISLRKSVKTDMKIEVEGIDTLAKKKHLKKKTVALPDFDTKGLMLDLASGELLDVPKADTERELRPAIEKLGKGDVVYDASSLILVRGATTQSPTETIAGLFNAIRIKPKWPVRLSITTKEGISYAIKVKSADHNSCRLEYYSLGKTDRPIGTQRTHNENDPMVNYVKSDREDLLNALTFLELERDRLVESIKNYRNTILEIGEEYSPYSRTRRREMMLARAAALEKRLTETEAKRVQLETEVKLLKHTKEQSISSEKWLQWRQDYINADSAVMASVEDIIELEKEILVDTQTMETTHPEVQRKTALLKKMKEHKKEKEKQAGQRFDEMAKKHADAAVVNDMLLRDKQHELEQIKTFEKNLREAVTQQNAQIIKLGPKPLDIEDLAHKLELSKKRYEAILDRINEMHLKKTGVTH